MQQIVEFILSKRKQLLFFVAFISLGMLWQVAHLSISYDFDSYFAKNEPYVKNFEKYQQQFPLGQNHQIVVSFESDEPISTAFAENSANLFDQIASVKGMKKAIYFSIVNDSKSVEESLEYVKERRSIYPGLLSADNKSLIGYFTIEPSIFNDTYRDSLVNQIQQIAHLSPFKSHVFGIPVIRSSYSEKILEDFLLFSVASILLILGVLYYLFRNVLLVIIPCLTIVLGIIWNFGLMGLLGFSINMISNLLVPILFVVGISDSIHLISVFYEKIVEGYEKEEAIRLSMAEVGKATFLTALVSSIGFLSLSFTSADAIKYFGIFGFTGIIITYFLSIIIVPSFLLFLDQKVYVNSTNLVNNKKWKDVFEKIYFLGLSKKNLIMGVFGVLIAGSLWLTSRIDTNLSFVSEVKKSDPIAQEFNYFEQQIGYLKPFEFVLIAKNPQQPINLTLVKKLEKIELDLNSRKIFSTFQSIVFHVKYANYFLHERNEAYFKFPETEQKLQYLLKQIQQHAEFKAFKLQSPLTLYFAGKIKDLGSEHMEEMEGQIKRQIESQVPFELVYTGFGHVLDQSNNNSRKEIFYGLFGDLIVVSLLMAFLFRKAKFIFISLIPNLIPLLILLGVVSLYKIPFSPANALILVVIFGISIDDTIHFLTHYLLIRSHENEPVRATLITCGKAMLFVSFLLMAGLGITFFSDFQAISNLGLFGMITIIFATLTEFLLTPILLNYLNPSTHE